MARTARAIVADHCYHLLNRGNNRARLFHSRADYIAFLWLLAEANDHVELPILAACVMPNHLHFVVQPRHRLDLARWAHWLFTTHARRHHRKYETTGRVWQGRFKASIVQHDAHLLTVLRYVERNALSANLCERAEEWEWSSLSWRDRHSHPVQLAPSPLALPSNWRDYVNAAQTPEEVEKIRAAIRRQAPFGDAHWTKHMAFELGLEEAVAPLGRPAESIVTTK